MKLTRYALLPAACATALFLAACGGTLEADTTEPAEPVEVEEVVEEPAEEVAAEVEEEPAPEPLETYAVGELVQMPSADFTVRVIEQRESIPSEFPDSTPDFTAGEGKRLWFFDIEWTNNTDEAVEKECHGPYMFDLQVYDVNGVEMLMVDQPGMIEGQECTTGLMKGETGTWMSAFTGPDSDFGWAVFTDYAGDRAIITLDPDLELYEE